MSVRSLLVAAIVSHMAAITKTNGYLTDIGADIFVWDTAGVLACPTPCLLICDTKLKRPPQKIIGQRLNLLTIEVAGVLRGPDAIDETARQMEEDIIKCLCGWETDGGIVDRLQAVDSTVGVEIQGQYAGGVTVMVEAEYYTADNQC